MKSALNQFILLGILCQGLTWDGYLIPSISVGLWILSLRLARRGVRLSQHFEAAALVAGCLAGYWLGKLPGQTSHFFIGYGITCVQLARAMRPLSARDKLFSIVAACVQLGVGCTVILDFRFVFVLLAAVYLIPRSLMELQRDQFPRSPSAADSPTLLPLPLPIPWSAYALIFFTMIAVFVGFPRAAIGSPLQSRRNANPNEGSLFDSILDPTRSGLAQSGKTIFQIEGSHIGLLRSFALVDFDGTRWLPDHRASLKGLRFVPTNDLPKLQHRRVRVKEVAFLGRVLPTDGPVSYLTGKFFRRPLQNFHGIIECDSMWNTANNIYEFWLNPQPRADLIPATMMARLTQHPEVSPRLRAWLEARVEGAASPREQASKLEAYFRDHFTYDLGAPVLKRLNALEEFLFEQRRGHCERYASAMALLLRMQGIPSRVVIGYLANSQSWFSGWHNVRFKDAHSWTEAYFPDHGWVQFDATPRSRELTTGLEVRDFVDALDLAWFMNVVSFDGAMQREFFSNAAQLAERTGAWFSGHRSDSSLVFLGGVGIIGGVWLLVFGRRFLRPRGKMTHRESELCASQYYRQMLLILKKSGLSRAPSQTPRELQEFIDSTRSDWSEHTAPITNSFCETHYGGRALHASEELALENALGRLKKTILSKPQE